MTYFQSRSQAAVRAAPTTAETYSAQVSPHDSRDLPKLPLREQLVLFAIGNRIRYGLAILRAIDECSNGRERITVGTLYPLLHGLEQKGLVHSRWGEESPSDRAGARRRYYQLTDDGQQAIKQTLAFQQQLLDWEESSSNSKQPS